jgi:hypothetical protein
MRAVSHLTITSDPQLERIGGPIDHRCACSQKNPQRLKGAGESVPYLPVMIRLISERLPFGSSGCFTAEMCDPGFSRRARQVVAAAVNRAIPKIAAAA